MKCKFCDRDFNISYVKESNKKIDIVDGKGEGPLGIFECRNVEIVWWDPKN